MCLIGIAHRASERYPLVIAANRDEDHDRPTHDAHFWEDAPEIAGGRDALHGGAWLAVTRGGRFAAVTNLRGAERRTRSRGALVRDFVTAPVDARTYAETIARVAHHYAGFHLLAGEVGGEAMYVSPAEQYELVRGIHGLSNAPAGEEWPKTAAAVERLQRAIEAPAMEAVIDDLMDFLSTPCGTNAVEREVFIRGTQYGTRASSVIIATAAEIVFVEQSYTRGGIVQGERRTLRFSR